jgi:predicted transcriptional regulator
MQQEKHALNSPWRHRRFPPDASSELPWDDQFRQPVLSHDRWKSRVDFNVFINSMDDESFGYLCLIREYATRSLQGKAVEYSGLYKAIVSQTAREEDMSHMSVIEFEADGLRSRTFLTFDDFVIYMQKIP